MVTAASTANLAIILIDARKGVLTQTRRHSYLASLVGIPTWWSRSTRWTWSTTTRRCSSASREYLAFAARLGIRDVRFIPISALEGDMIVDRGERLSWYDGPTLLDILENAPVAHHEQAEDFRFPVQFVCRPQELRQPPNCTTTAASWAGSIRRDRRRRHRSPCLPSGASSRVRKIELGGVACRAPSTSSPGDPAARGRDRHLARRPDREIRRSARAGQADRRHRVLAVETPLSPARTYLVRHTTREVKAKLAKIDCRLDVNTLEQEAATAWR